MRKSQRISKEAHVERMGNRAARRANDARELLSAYRDDTDLRTARIARSRNGVGRPPRGKS